MIQSVYLDDTRLDNAKRLLQSIKNGAFPEVKYTKSDRGGFAGLDVAVGGYRSFAVLTEWMIRGDDFSDFADQREEFVGVLNNILKNGSATLKINKTNGVNVQIEVLAAKVTGGDLSAVSPLSSKLLVEFVTEYPAFVSQTEQSQDIYIYTGGGMAIPTSIPLDMSSGGSNDVVLVNNGNVDAYPVFTFYGPLTNPSLTNIDTSKTLNVSYALDLSSDYIVIDVYNRTATLYPSGANVRQYVSGDFWTLQPGNNLVHLSASEFNTSGKVNITFRDHYLGV